MSLRQLAASLILSTFCLNPTAVGQAWSPIGKFVEPWGGWGANPIAMTPDGKWVAFVEAEFICTGGTKYRISMMHPDGTGYFVVLDDAALKALHEPAYVFSIQQLRISGDGSTLYFWWQNLSGDCTGNLGFHRYLVDVASGQAKEFFHNGQLGSDVSFTDSGRLMVFKAYDAATGSWWHWRAKPDGSDAVKFLDASPWSNDARGIVSGDGTKFAFVGHHGPWPFPSDVYVFDFATSTVTKVSPATLDDIWSVSCSKDGSRVVYAQYTGFELHAVNGDGSGHRLIPIPTTAKSTETLTRDGHYIFFGKSSASPPYGECYRVGWNGSGMEIVSEFWQAGLSMNQVPVNADGSLQVHWSTLGTIPFLDTGFVTRPLTLTVLAPPMLTTNGFGTPGTTLYWDVAGNRGNAFILAWALHPASLPFKTYGTLGLDPSSLTILSAGLINTPQNTAHLEVALPASLAVPVPVPAYFQALVLNATGGKLTNTTAVMIGGAAQMASSNGGPPLRATRAGLDWLYSQPRSEPTPEERIQLLMAMDPAIEGRMESQAASPERRP